MIFKLDKKLAFPDPRLGEEDGLLAVGGDLSTDRLILAYSYGIFPWYSYRDSIIEWWCPMDRFVIFPEKIHISHSMRTLINKGKHQMSMNMAFDDVIRNCGALRDDKPGAWLGPDMIKAYTKLKEQGFAASVEVWECSDEVNPENGEPIRKLVGGLYGVCIGRCFFGESMFSLVPSASKLALIYLAKTMQKAGCVMIDCQFETEHLKTMGGEHITYDEYMKYVQAE